MLNYHEWTREKWWWPSSTRIIMSNLHNVPFYEHCVEILNQNRDYSHPLHALSNCGWTTYEADLSPRVQHTSTRRPGAQIRNHIKTIRIIHSQMYIQFRHNWTFVHFDFRLSHNYKNLHFIYCYRTVFVCSLCWLSPLLGVVYYSILPFETLQWLSLNTILWYSDGASIKGNARRTRPEQWLFRNWIWKYIRNTWMQ